MDYFKCGEVYRSAEGRLTYTCHICPDEYGSANEFEEHLVVHFVEAEEPDEELEDEPATSIIKIEAVSDSEFIVEGHDDDDDNVDDLDDDDHDDDDHDIEEEEEQLETTDAEIFDEIEVLDYENQNERVIRCNCCNEYYMCLGSMEKGHRTIENPAKMCGECPAYFEKRDQLLTHRKVHKLDTVYSCMHCSMMFATEDELLVHTVSDVQPAKPKTDLKRKHHQVAKQEVEVDIDDDTEDIATQAGDGKGRSRYMCNICQKEYTYLHYLKQHLKKHKDNTLLHSCDVCGHQFKLRQNLLAHKRIHTGEKPYVCKLCGKSFNQPYYMTVHMRIHQKEKPYQCNLCGVSFVTSSHLGRHMKSHNNIKPHKCTLCEKAFILPGHLHDHIRSQHTGERPFSCEVGFVLSKILNLHQFRIRLDGMRLTNKFLCSLIFLVFYLQECGSTFSRRKLLRQHMQLHGEKRFKCKYCDMAFAQSAGRRGHEIRVHAAN